MKNILYVYRTAREGNLEKIKRGEEPDHLLYGMNYLNQKKYRVFFSDKAYWGAMPIHWVTYPIEKFLINRTSIGFKLDQALLLLPEMKKADVIITTADSAGLPILLLKKLKLIEKPIIYISTGLINELNIRKKSKIARWYFSLFEEIEVIVCHSIIETELFKKLAPRIRKKVILIPFGIDVKFFKGKRTQGDFIFSVGRDRSRDYKLLLDTAGELQKEKFVVVTSKSNVKDITFPSNVTLFFDLPYKKVKKLYQKSRLVFIPLKDINRASGQISFLESLASGKKVVISNVLGIRDVYKDLSRSSDVFFYKPGNVLDSMNQIKKAFAEKSKVKSLHKKFTSQYYARQIESVIEH